MSTKIEWCVNPDGSQGETWNPIAMRCTRVSEGCGGKNKKGGCWHQHFADRHAINPAFPSEARTAYAGGAPWLNPAALVKPLSWHKPRMIAVQLMGDLFHESIHLSYIADVFSIMASRTAACGKNHKHMDECWTGDFHTFLILTKRVERMKKVLGGELQNFIADKRAGSLLDEAGTWPLPNVWLGVSTENQQRWNERVPVLLSIPAAKHFVSVEPCLSQIDINGYYNGLDWVICGKENGPGARPFNGDWARILFDQCLSAGIPFFYKNTDAFPAMRKFPKGYLNGA